MPIPPILDVFVVWHPDDPLGAQRFRDLHRHFHGSAFSGLAGGAVEVYSRSEGWQFHGAAPRPLGIAPPRMNGLPAAQFNAIVPVVDVNLVRSLQDDKTGWEPYLGEILSLHGRPGVGVYPIVADDLHWDGQLRRELQTLPRVVNHSPGHLGREVAQAITQRIQQERGLPKLLTVFVSHTRKRSAEENAFGGESVLEHVRHQIRNSHLEEFFDAHDIQPGTDWEKTLEEYAARSALLMVRTDEYAGQDWTQREVRIAKQNGMPVVSLYSLRAGEERGSFLMDHVPSAVCDPDDPGPGIDVALNRLVDEALKNALWHAQSSYLSSDGFDWLPAHAPEPATLVPWLKTHRASQREDRHLWVMHPDPPLGTAERRVLDEICALAGYDVDVDVLTPRTFAARGGTVKR